MTASMWTATEDEELETALSGLKDLPEDEPMRWELAVGLVGRGRRTPEDLKLRYNQLQEDLLHKDSGLPPLYTAGTEAAVTGAASRTTPCTSPTTSSGSSSDFDQAMVFTHSRQGNSMAVTFNPSPTSISGWSSEGHENDSTPSADANATPFADANANPTPSADANSNAGADAKSTPSADANSKAAPSDEDHESYGDNSGFSVADANSEAAPSDEDHKSYSDNSGFSVADANSEGAPSDEDHKSYGDN